MLAYAPQAASTKPAAETLDRLAPPFGRSCDGTLTARREAWLYTMLPLEPLVWADAGWRRAHAVRLQAMLAGGRDSRHKTQNGLATAPKKRHEQICPTGRCWSLRHISPQQSLSLRQAPTVPVGAFEACPQTFGRPGSAGRGELGSDELAAVRQRTARPRRCANLGGYTERCPSEVPDPR